MAHLSTAKLIEHALALIAAAAVERPVQAARIRDDLERWRHGSWAHEQAYAEALRRWQALGMVLPAVRERFDAPQPAARWRRAGAMGGIAALLVGATVALLWYLQQPTFVQRYQTATAQTARLSLPDGSRIDLNAQSHVHVTLYRHRRVMVLAGV